MNGQHVVACAVLTLALTCVAPAAAFAHCDALDGPVVKAAQRALDTQTIADVLIWVRADDEAEVRAVFKKTIAVRALGAEAKELADRFFFETVVRLHRAGEGEPFTGLKPAGLNPGAAVAAADAALDRGSPQPLVRMLTQTLHHELLRSFREVRAARTSTPGDLAGGRAYVKAYVDFMHYVERVHAAIAAAEPDHAATASHKRPS